MTELNITAASPVDDVMRGWPETIRAFLDHRRDVLRQRDIAQDGATNITICYHPQQMLLLIHDQTDPQGLFIDHC